MNEKKCRICNQLITDRKYIKLNSTNLSEDVVYIHSECKSKIKCYVCGENINLKEEENYDLITTKATTNLWFKHSKCNANEVCYVCKKKFKKGEHPLRISMLYRHNECEFLSNNYLLSSVWKNHIYREIFEPLGYSYGLGLTEKEKTLLNLIEKNEISVINNKNVREKLNIDSFEASYILSNLVKKNIFTKERKGKEVIYKKIMED